MKKNLLILIATAALVLAFSMVLMAQDEAETPTYVGVDKCKMCHKGEKNGMIFETWEAEKHAHAYQAVIDKGETENTLCMQCHTTGYGAGGYDPAAENKDEFANVQCEACHGPGSMYKKMSVMKDKEAAIAAGLVMPTEETCLQCHNDKYHKDMTFNFAEAVQKIEHKLPEKTTE